MLSRDRFAAAVLWGGCLLVLTQGSLAWGQRRPDLGRPPQMRKPPGKKPTMVDASGTIVAMASGLIKINTPTGQPWMLRMSRETKVQVRGTAKKDVLRRGNFVSFTADVDKRTGRVQDKVAKLTLFTPSQHRIPGVFPDQGGPGVEGDGGAFGADLFADDSPRKRRPTRTKDSGPPIERFEIAAQITGIKKDGRITVRVPPNRYFKPILEIELAEEPEIELDVAGLATFALAKKGDRIEARGHQVGPGMARLTEVTVKLAEPWTTIKPKKVSPRRDTRSRRTKGEDDEEAVEAEEENEGEKAKKAARRNP